MCQPQSSHALPTASLRSACGRPPRFPLRWRARQQRRPSKCRARSVRSRFGFSLTELLVVIGIIVLLVGILLVALGKVKVTADKTRTESVMQQFINAATAFQAENGRFPGVIPETILANNPGGPQITSTENALLDLLGGYRVLSPTDQTAPISPVETAYNDYLADAALTSSDIEITWNVSGGGVWKLAIDTRKIGEGPVINGKPHAPYFTPGAGDLVKAGGHDDIPDLADAWGQPILYLRQLRERGPLVAPSNNTPAPQFLRGGLLPYIQSTALGELLKDQTALSILNTSSSNPPIGGINGEDLTMAKLVGHAAFVDPVTQVPTQAKGGMCLISAGADGVYFSHLDGPGSQSSPVDNIVNNGQAEFNNPKVVDDYDDVRVFGGA